MTNWAIRAKRYDDLEYASKSIPFIRQAIDFDKYDVILDAGCGTGKVACAIHELVNLVIGIDSSPAMLNQSPNSFTRCLGDIKYLPYQDNTFTKIIARLVLHHLVEWNELESALREFYRVLRPGGMIIVQEGIPPKLSLAGDYAQIFALKEHRRTFTQEGLITYLELTRFTDVRSYIFTEKLMSINNWLDNDGTLTDEAKKQIYSLHKHASHKFKKAYNLRELSGDILIDSKVVVVTGVKP